jgi:Enoyl-CoA hydratase/carnithine racemase
MTSNIKIIKINSEISSIILNEPKTYNSLSFKNLTDLLKVLKKLDADNKLKVIII